jgi:hypothetical protein
LGVQWKVYKYGLVVAPKKRTGSSTKRCLACKEEQNFSEGNSSGEPPQKPGKLSFAMQTKLRDDNRLFL